MKITMKKKFPELKQQVLELHQDAHAHHIFSMAARMQLPDRKVIVFKQGNESKDLEVTRIAMGPLQTPYGEMWLFKFEIDDEWSNYSVLVKCPKIDDETLLPVFVNKNELLLRVDSGCETGHIFLDNTCECPDQLRQSMVQVMTHGEGVIITIPKQDGRGKGSAFKLTTLFLQKELGLNTVQSAAYLAGDEDIDVRTYYGVISILTYFGIESGDTTINFATNNPDKLRVFVENNFEVHNTPVHIEPTEQTSHHLEAKKNYLKHELI